MDRDTATTFILPVFMANPAFASCGLPLSREEELAIWWHMGEHEEPFDQPEVYESTKSIPLCNLIRHADHVAAAKKEPKYNR